MPFQHSEPTTDHACSSEAAKESLALREMLARNVRVLWETLTNDFNLCVAIIDRDGRTLYPNKVFLGKCPRECLPLSGGEHLEDLFGKELGDQWLGYVRHSIDESRPLIVDGALHGFRMRTIIRPMQAEPGEVPCVLLVGRRLADRLAENDQDAGGPEHITADIQDMGRLKTLTPREMDVLRLIGNGLSTAQIAEHLDRSTKTIEWHRASLGSKLSVKSRVQLARIAILAGLCELPSEATIRSDAPDLPEPVDN